MYGIAWTIHLCKYKNGIELYYQYSIVTSYISTEYRTCTAILGIMNYHLVLI